MNRGEALVKNTLILSIGQFLPKLTSFITLPILTTYLTQSAYGTYDLVNSMAMLLLPIMTLQIHQGVFRYLIQATTKNDKAEYLTSALTFILISTIVLFPIIYFSLYFFGLTSLECFMICLFLFSEAYYLLFGQVIRGLGENLKYSISVVVYAVVNTVLLVILVLGFKLGIIGVLLSSTLGYSFAAIFMMMNTVMHSYIKKSSFSKERLIEMIKFSAPIVPSTLSLWVVSLSDRIIITAFLGVNANAFYSVANKIPSLYSMAYTSFNLAWVESAARAADDADMEKYYSDLFRKLFNFLVGIMLILIAVSPAVFKVLVNKQYDEAFEQIPILFFGVFFNSFVSFYGGIYIALKKTRQVGMSALLGGILNIIINLLLIKKYGLFAASISTALSYMIIVLYRSYDLNKYIKIMYNKTEIFSGMSLFVCSAMICSLRTLFGYIICIVIAIIFNLIKNRKLGTQTLAMFKKYKK